MMLERQNPERVEDRAESLASVLARGAGFLQGELEGLGAVEGDRVSTLGLVDNLDEVGVLGCSMHEDLGLLHVALANQLVLIVWIHTVDLSEIRRLGFIASADHGKWLGLGGEVNEIVLFFVVGSEQKLGRGVVIIKSVVDLVVLLDHSLDPAHQSSLLVERERLEDESKSDLGLLREKFALNKTNQVLVHVGECLEDESVQGKTSSALFEESAFNFLVGVLEQVQNRFRVKRVEQGLVAHFDPVDHFAKVFHRLPVELVERHLAEQGVKVFEEERKLGLQGLLVEVNDTLSKRVVFEVQVVGAVEGA